MTLKRLTLAVLVLALALAIGADVAGIQSLDYTLSMIKGGF